MLSFIYHIAHEFEQNHGLRPNMVYLNREQFTHLHEELASIRNLDTMARLLGMEIVLSPESTHPRVTWSSVDWRTAVAV
jgi:hypothetical protein